MQRLFLFLAFLSILSNCTAYRSICASITMLEKDKEFKLNYYIYNINQTRLQLDISLITMRVVLDSEEQSSLINIAFQGPDISSLLRTGHNMVELGFDNVKTYYSEIRDLSWNKMEMKTQDEDYIHIQSVFVSPYESENPIYGQMYDLDIPKTGHFEIYFKTRDSALFAFNIQMEGKTCASVENELKHTVFDFYSIILNSNRYTIIGGIYPIFLRIYKNGIHKVLLPDQKEEQHSEKKHEIMVISIIVAIASVLICIILKINS